MSGREFSIRAAVPADAPELARLRYAFRTGRHASVETESAFLERCTEWMAERVGLGAAWRCWVAVSDGKLAGTLWLQLIEKLPNPGTEPERHGYISSVYVVPALRNGGMGSALLGAALRKCEAEEVDAVFLWSTPGSRPLYQRNGFAVREDLLDRR